MLCMNCPKVVGKIWRVRSLGWTRHLQHTPKMGSLKYVWPMVICGCCSESDSWTILCLHYNIHRVCWMFTLICGYGVVIYRTCALHLRCRGCHIRYGPDWCAWNVMFARLDQVRAAAEMTWSPWTPSLLGTLDLMYGDAREICESRACALYSVRRRPGSYGDSASVRLSPSYYDYYLSYTPVGFKSINCF